MGDLKDVKKQLLAKAKGIKITNPISVTYLYGTCVYLFCIDLRV